MSQQTEERNSSTIQTTRFSPSWPQEPLVNLIDKQRGISYGIVQPGQHDPDGVPIIRVNNIKNGALDLSELRRVAPAISASYRRTILRGGELLLTIVGTVGESLIASDNQAGWNVARAIAVIPVREEISSQWVRVCLRSAPLQGLIKDWCNTTVQPTLNLSDVAKLPIPLPPQKTRNRIAEILGRLDDKIEVNRRINRTLEAMAQALYKHWFVDFGPFQAGEFVESELGLIPSGWQTGSLFQLCERIENGGTPKRNEPTYWNPGTVPWLTSGEVRTGIVIVTENLISEAGLENSSAKLWPKNTTVIAMYGATAGQVCLLGAEMCANQACCGLVPKGGIESYIYWTVRHIADELSQHAIGSAQQNLSQRIIRDYSVLLPDLAIAQRFHNTVSSLTTLMIKNTQQNRKLAEIRDYLLPKLLSGEIPVAAAAVEALATSRNDKQQILEAVKHPLK